MKVGNAGGLHSGVVLRGKASKGSHGAPASEGGENSGVLHLRERRIFEEAGEGGPVLLRS